MSREGGRSSPSQCRTGTTAFRSATRIRVLTFVRRAYRSPVTCRELPCEDHLGFSSKNPTAHIVTPEIALTHSDKESIPPEPCVSTRSMSLLGTRAIWVLLS